MSTRPVSPHEKAFVQRQAGNRFNVTPETIAKVTKQRNKAIGFKPMTARLMEASGRRSFVPGQRRPSPAPSR